MPKHSMINGFSPLPQFLLLWGSILAGILGIFTLLAILISKNQWQSTSHKIIKTYFVALGSFSGVTGLFWLIFTTLSGGAEKMSGNIVMIVAVSLNALAGLVYAMNEKQLPSEYQPHQMQKIGILLGSVNIGMYSGAMALGMSADKLQEDTKVIGFIICLLAGGVAGLCAAAIVLSKEKWLQTITNALSELQTSKGAQKQFPISSIPGFHFFNGWLIGTLLAIITGLSTTAAIAYIS